MRELTDGEQAEIDADARLRAALGSRRFGQVNEGGICGCGECGERFAGLAHFDAHRPPAASDEPCHAPASVGLVQDPRGVWFDPVSRARAQARFRAGTSAKQARYGAREPIPP